MSDDQISHEKDHNLGIKHCVDGAHRSIFNVESAYGKCRSEQSEHTTAKALYRVIRVKSIAVVVEVKRANDSGDNAVDKLESHHEVDAP